MAQIFFSRDGLAISRGFLPLPTRLVVATRDRPPTANCPAIRSGDKLLLSEPFHVPTAALSEPTDELQRCHPGLLTFRGVFVSYTRDDFDALPGATDLVTRDEILQQQPLVEHSQMAEAWRLNAPCRFAATVWSGDETLRVARVTDNLDLPVDWSLLRRAASWLLDIATALEFLKTEGTPHGSVRFENVVVTADGRAKLGHFDWFRGRQLEVRCCDRAVTKIDRHAAPELLRETIASGRLASSFAGDVYGLGLLAIDLATGEAPFSTLSDEEIEELVTSERDLGLRPDDCASISDAEWCLLSPLLARDPDRRPSIEEAVEVFTVIYSGDAETFAFGSCARGDVRGRSRLLVGQQRGRMLPQRGE